jgi:hypothetical protein
MKTLRKASSDTIIHGANPRRGRATLVFALATVLVTQACSDNNGDDPADPNIRRVHQGLNLVPLVGSCTQNSVSAMTKNGDYVVGTCWTDADRTEGQAYIWKRGEVAATGLGHLSAGATLSSAADITDNASTVVGYDVDSSGIYHAFVYDVHKGEMAPIPTALPTWYTQSRATAITPDGKTIVGCISLPTSLPCTEAPVSGTKAPSGTPPSSPFLWTSDGGFVTPTPDWEFASDPTGQSVWLTSAWAVSDDGTVVVGDKYTGFGLDVGISSYRWTSIGGEVDLGTALFELSADAPLYSTPRAMSSNGEFVAGATRDVLTIGSAQVINLLVPYLWTAEDSLEVLEQRFPSEVGVLAMTPHGDVMGGGWFDPTLDAPFDVDAFSGFIWDDRNGMMELLHFFDDFKGDNPDLYTLGEFVPINVTALSDSADVLAGDALVPSVATPIPLRGYAGTIDLPPR